MISVRYHIVSIAAVFLALALGIVLGATKVQSPILVGLQDDRSQLTQQRDDLQRSNAALQAQVSAGTQFADDVSSLAVRGTLPGQTVVLISTQDADPGDRDALLSLLSRSGAKVTAQLTLTQDFTDPSRSGDLQSLVAKSLPAGAKIPEAAAATGTIAGALLSSVLVTDAQGKAPAKSAEASAALSALSSGGFLTADGALAPGRLVVLLTGATPTGGSEDARSTVVADLAQQLRSTAGGVVVAGRTGSADATGAVAALRGDSGAVATVSTVDDVDTSVGRVGAVLALVEQAGGGAGQYGTGAGARAPVPVLAVG